MGRSCDRKTKETRSVKKASARQEKKKIRPNVGQLLLSVVIKMFNWHSANKKMLKGPNNANDLF